MRSAGGSGASLFPSGEGDDPALPEVHPLEEGSQRLEELRETVVEDLQALDTLDPGHREALLDLVEDLGEGSLGADLPAYYRWPDREEEGRALGALYGTWLQALAQTLRGPQAGELAAYPLPVASRAHAFLALAREGCRDPAVVAARVEALAFLERTGFHDAVMGMSHLASFTELEARVGALSSGELEPGDRLRVDDKVRGQVEVLVEMLEARLGRTPPERQPPPTLGEARSRRKRAYGVVSEYFPPSLLRALPPPETTAASAPLEPPPTPEWGEELAAGVPAPPGGGLPWIPGGILCLVGLGVWLIRSGGQADPASEVAVGTAFDPASDFPTRDGLPGKGGRQLTGSETRVTPGEIAAQPVDPRRTELSAPPSGGPVPGVAPAAAVPEGVEPRFASLPGWLRGSLRSRLPERYQELSLVASGGMGSIVRSWDRRLERWVAIKVAPPHLAGVEQFRTRFYREAQALARIEHENIAQIYDIPEAPEQEAPLMIMEFLEGEDLGEYLERHGAAPAALGLRWVHQVGEVLDHVHREGILHRDVKPANIFLLEEGGVKLVDFGLVHFQDMTRITVTGMRMGSQPYMPPEQIRGEQVGPAADQYALAVTTFELLTGDLPFAPDDSLRYAPPSLQGRFPEATPELDAVLRRALDPDPRQRFESVGAFLAALPR